MEQKSSMTALVSAYARAYHAAHRHVKAFDDSVAGRLLTETEQRGIGAQMAAGAAFFFPGFSGTPEETLQKIVDEQLSPTPLGRAAYAEEQLRLSAAAGARQYLILAAGYDTFAWRQPAWAGRLRIFELDLPATAADKRARLAAAALDTPDNCAFIETDFRNARWVDALRTADGFDPCAVSFCTLLGVSYYLTRETFSELLVRLGMLIPAGSRIVLDYPDENAYTDKAGARAKKQALLAQGAGEPMRASYAASEMEALLNAAGFRVLEQLTPAGVTERCFSACNRADPAHPVTAFDNVNYCLAEKA